ncbi:uncharacterized protein DDB_G0283357-like [Aplysia californica]|uniref:Uncharacterized protein DDB_G0283357-like n=1 Tax=Aplysia californica TaxID=6500 RepID=A0ABM0JM62_APLCA|nr:uncharacterized protein DDB_G0283357-like [Aplysia californica]
MANKKMFLLCLVTVLAHCHASADLSRPQLHAFPGHANANNFGSPHNSAAYGNPLPGNNPGYGSFNKGARNAGSFYPGAPNFGANPPAKQAPVVPVKAAVPVAVPYPGQAKVFANQIKPGQNILQGRGVPQDRNVFKPLQTNSFKPQQSQVPAFLPSSSSGQYPGNNVYQQNRVFQPVSLPKEKSADRERFLPILDNRYIPPTTFKKEPKSLGSADSLFAIADPKIDRRNAINSYVPQNNFVDPTNFIIPTDDKYQIVDSVFGGFGKAISSGPSSFPGGSKGIGTVGGLRNSFMGIGPKFGFQGNQGTFGINSSPLGSSQQFQKKNNNLQKTTLGNADGGNFVRAQGQLLKATSAPFVSGSKSGDNFLQKQGFADQGRQTFNNNYDSKSSDSGNRLIRNFGGDSSGSVFSKPAPSNFGGFSSNPGPDIFKERVGSQSPYGDTSLFNSPQSMTPLFTGFTPNKRLSVNDFRSKDLLGDKDFGVTPYDKNRQTSFNLVGGNNDFNNFNGFPQYNNPTTKTQSTLAAGTKGNNLFGVGQSTLSKNGYDNSNGGSQSYSKSFGDNFATGSSGRFGGSTGASQYNNNAGNSGSGGGKFNTFGNGLGKSGGSVSLGDTHSGSAGGFPKSQSYQEVDSTKNGGGYSHGNSYAKDLGYNTGSSSGGQYSDSDNQHHDFQDGYDRQQTKADKKSFSNSDGYNNAFRQGKNFDVTDGYNDNVNYNNKNSDSSQTQYTTKEGYDQGVSNVASGLAGGQNIDPYRGLRSSVQQGVGPNASYKPFDVNKRVF